MHIMDITGPAEAGVDRKGYLGDADRADLSIDLGDDRVGDLAVPEGDAGDTLVRTRSSSASPSRTA